MNLALAFCSIRPTIYSDSINNCREQEYLTSLIQMKHVLPPYYSWKVLDNTIQSLDHLKSFPLRDFLAINNAVLTSQNTGTQNKGIGELDMLIRAHTDGLFTGYDRISYLGGRNIITCPYFFERSEQLTKSALVNNSPYLYFVSGKLSSNSARLFNTNAFTFQTPVMVEFIKYVSQTHIMKEMSDMKLGVEQAVFRFIEECGISYETIEWLGILRNDWVKTNEALNVNNYHIM